MNLLIYFWFTCSHGSDCYILFYFLFSPIIQFQVNSGLALVESQDPMTLKVFLRKSLAWVADGGSVYFNHTILVLAPIT